MWQGHLLLSPGWITPRLPTSSIKAGKHAERWRDEAHVNLHLVSSVPFRVFGACEKETGILLHCRAFLSLLAEARNNFLCYVLYLNGVSSGVKRSERSQLQRQTIHSSNGCAK